MQENKAMIDLANKLNNKTKTFFDTVLDLSTLYSKAPVKNLFLCLVLLSVIVLTCEGYI